MARSMKGLLVLSLLIFFFSTNASAGSVTEKINDDINIIVDVKEEYTLGDSDTMIDAENIILQKAKVAATEYSGSYIESLSSVSDGKITSEVVRIIAAGFQEVVSKDFERVLKNDGRLVVVGSLTIKTAKQSIKESIDKIRTDKRKLEAIKKLKEENDRLNERLEQLIAQTKNADIKRGSFTRDNIIKERNKTLKSLNKNGKSAKKLINGSALLEMVRREDAEHLRAVEEIEQDIVQTYLNGIDVTVGSVIIERQRSGKYLVSVPISWFDGDWVKNLRLKTARHIDTRYLDPVSPRRGKERLFMVLAETKIYLNVSIGERKIRRRIFGAYWKKSRGTGEYYADTLDMDLIGYTNKKLYGFDKRLMNSLTILTYSSPLEIGEFDKEELAYIDEIEWSIERVRLKFNKDRTEYVEVTEG